ncbi:GTPase-activating protein GYP5 [Trametes pubescens]|uniref:GTPase-activating protein GYP5 n=1 Tax=Trametes pubescens TaxID=154538 RepID=A0A1M2VBF1_TRAPU|nr:GTPase-activating protein GYP5 [Trametes pubescens]
MSEEAQNASKTLAPLVTATEPTTLTTAETDTPVSPEMPTVTASNPPSRLSSIAEDKATASASTNPTESASRDASEEGPTKEEVSETSAAAEPQAGQSTPDNQSAEVKSVPESSISEDNDEYLSSKEETSGESVSASSAKPRTSIPPPVLTDTTSATSPATLDSLLSPTETEGKFSIRESVAASDVTDDETRFSTVLLSSARQSLNLTPGPKVSVASSDLVSVDEGTGSDEITLVDDWRKHKKTASNSTILSVSNVPYLISQLDEGAGADSRSRPNSMGGKIREEFYQKQPAGEVRDYTAEGEVVVDWDFWGQVMNDYQGFASQHPEQLARAIERGIPKALRGMVWQLMSASKDPELEATYLRLLKETSPHEKAIMRDLGRTFPHHAFFTDGHGIGQENLFNVLKAYSLYDPQVGYCQGLPFIVAILLLNMPDEEAFCLLVRLMHSYDVRGHFLPDMPKLQLRLFERLLEELLPVLHLHFVRQGIKASMYCSQWFLTMFSYRFPMDIVFRIYDNVLASGIEAMFTFSMTLLIKNEETLLSMKFDQLLSFLNIRVFEVYQVEPPYEGQTDVKYHVDHFVQDAMSLRITPFMLDSYAHEYEELVRARDAHKLELDTLKNTNRQLVAQVKNLESNLAQLNTEHCEVLNELVRARLRHEDLESELVRYKLLYAEAMHQSEDAMSSHRISLVASSKRGSASTTDSRRALP